LSRPRIVSISPLSAIEGGRVTIEGSDLVDGEHDQPQVEIGNVLAHVVSASSNSVSVIVPQGCDGGQLPVRLGSAPGETAFLGIGRPIATGLHQVDSPVVDSDGSVYVTYSGSRGERSPVSVFRVRRDGFREPFVTGITNATSLAFSPDGELYVSSRFEGSIYCVATDGTFETFAKDLGVTCGMAFSPEGTLYVGDRSGTIFRVGSDGEPSVFAAVPASVAAFHLAWGPDNGLYVTAPTLASYDSVYRVDTSGVVAKINSDFGRPQGLSFDPKGSLCVVEALAGQSGLYRLPAKEVPTKMVAASNLVGAAFGPFGELIVTTNDTAYRFDSVAV